MYSNRKKLQYTEVKFISFSSDGFTTVSKGGLISESFSLWLQSQKKVPDHSSEHFASKEKMISAQMWEMTVFCPVGVWQAPVKNFSRSWS